MTFADKILHFNFNLSLDDQLLPEGIRAMNPFSEGANSRIGKVTTAFYQKFYSDQNRRQLLLGINPGRLGGGATGIPFTDTKRLADPCGITVEGLQTHEPSSVFIYEVIAAYGGPEAFYRQHYISSICPLGFVTLTERGTEVNYNYYDNAKLAKAVTPFMVEQLKKQLAFGIDCKKVLVLGTGKNYKFISKLNQEHGFFKEVVPLEHPRYVMQYKNKQKDFYIDKYLQALAS